MLHGKGNAYYYIWRICSPYLLKVKRSQRKNLILYLGIVLINTTKLNLSAKIKIKEGFKGAQVSI
jgi:hypothetical protein